MTDDLRWADFWPALWLSADTAVFIWFIWAAKWTIPAYEQYLIAALLGRGFYVEIKKFLGHIAVENCLSLIMAKNSVIMRFQKELSDYAAMVRHLQRQVDIERKKYQGEDE